MKKNKFYHNWPTLIGTFFADNKVSFEGNITFDDSIVFIKEINGRSIYLELHFFEEEDEVPEMELVANVYQNGECKLAYGGNVLDVLNTVQKHLK